MESPPESNQNKLKNTQLTERFLKSWFPPAAVVGALSSFVTAAFRPRSAVQAPAAQAPSLVQIDQRREDLLGCSCRAQTHH